MPFWRLYYHLVWPTHHREPWIRPEIEDRLYGYLVSRAGEQGVYTYAVNGWFDHVHMVVAVPPLLAVSELVKQLKGASSRFLHTEAGLPAQFTWQRGYGALSVGERQRPVAERYVERQKEHHARQTTNSWLEYVAEADDGPTRPGDTQQVREAQQPYDQDEFPF